MSLRILLVEDHDDSRLVLSNLLRRFGYDVDVAGTYRSASESLEKSQFDVLLSDIGLPDGNGCDLATEAKKKNTLVAIALTAWTRACDIQQGIQAGFDHYLSKPLDVLQLRTILSQI